MGEVDSSSEEMEVMKKTTPPPPPPPPTTDGKKDGLIKWERFLPRMALRVLLIEADDSTRQIVSALLRKSSYTVNAVSDGLKAWEILKGRPQNIDIILTEVDLPSISGFALLTLVMEHEICKNIPVIMMSSQDSVSTVYKCMLRGAADYLVKPVRRNELRNLWQHVWRRQSTTIGGNICQDESVGQKKIDASSANDAASNHSSGHMDWVQRDEECNDKGSDSQSSCTKPDFESDCAHKEDTQDLSMQLGGKCLPDDVKMQKHKSCVNYSQKSIVHESEAGGSGVAVGGDANREKAYLGKDVEPESQRKDLIFPSNGGDIHVSSSREVIDFMGAWSNLKSSSNSCTSKFDSSQLDLSLRRCHPSGFETQVTELKFTLKPSNASAFTRYTNRPLQPLHSALTSACNRQKEFDSEKNLSNIVTTCNSDTPVAMLSTQRSINSLAINQSKQSELENSCPQHRVGSVQVPVEGMRLNNVYTGYGSVRPHIFCAQPGLSPIPSPSSANEQVPTFRVNQMYCSNVENGNCAQSYDRLGENAINSTNQTMHRLDSLEDQGHISAATDQSASSSFCNGAISRITSLGYGSACGSNSNVDQGAVGRVSDSKNEEGLIPSSGNSHRSIQREAALNKFRLKRKDRCYEKKVRYESRKKLAEQRPRVKGQFVRQVHADPAPAES